MYFSKREQKQKKKQNNFSYGREERINNMNSNFPFDMSIAQAESYFRDQDQIDRQWLKPKECLENKKRINNKAKKREEKLFKDLANNLFSNQNQNKSKIKASQILKTLSALLLVVLANEALAWDLDAGITAAVKPLHDGITKWWGFGIGLPACFGAMVGEGDLRTRGKNAGIGALSGGAVTLGLLGLMGAIA